MQKRLLGIIRKDSDKFQAVSKNWEKWKERKEMIEAMGDGEMSSNWIKWSERLAVVLTTEHFNMNSSAHLAWLFYDKLQFPILVKTPNGDPSTGSKALPGFGELGGLLKNVKLLEKEFSYVTSLLKFLREDDEGRHRLHPQFRCPGTLTGRLAGTGGLNLQQIPKSKRYLDAWYPKPGKVWIDCDHTSLEQVVMAELTRDDSLYKIYGPDARPNDIYLFNGSQLPVIGEIIRAAGYDPDNPTEESIAHVKKVCKRERGISKVITLGSSYGMGAEKLQMTLKLQGINITEDQAKQMHGAYWDLYSGVKDYEKYLLKELKQRNGYVLNGIGRPVCCAADFTKDIVNRVCQSTGHDLHMMYIQICNELFEENNLNVDGIVWDFHDQTIVECDEQDAELVYFLIGTKAYEILNDKYIKGIIKLKGDPQYIKTMTDAKCG